MIDWSITKNTKDKISWVELRADFYRGNLMIFVGPNGWHYGKNERPLSASGTWAKSTRDYDIRFGTNGPLFLTFEDWAEINAKIEEAKEMLNGQ